MPRISHEPDPDSTTPEQFAAFAKYLDGDGSSTFDVCTKCFDDLGGDGAPWPSDVRLEPYSGNGTGGLTKEEQALFDALVYVILDTGDHPPYEDEGFSAKCAVCNRKLTDKKDA